MADTKISGLTADTTPTSDDIIPTVNDPGGTPANKKVTLANAITKAHGLSDSTVVGVSSGILTSGVDVAVTDGGTGSSTASGARTNLGVAIGSDVQAFDADLATIAGLTATTDNFMVATSSAWASRTPSQARTQLGLGSVATLSTVDLTANVTGVLPIANGGTNSNSQTSGGVIYNDGTKNTSGMQLKFDGTNLGVGVVPDSLLTVSKQTTIVAPPTGTTAHFVGLDANSLRITFDTHNAGTGGTALFGRHSRGTAASPAALNSADTIYSFNAQGFGATAYPAASTGLISFKAAEAFTDTAMGTDFVVTTTPTSSVSAAEVARFTGTQLKLGVVGTMLGSLVFNGNTSGSTTVQSAAAASGTLTLPSATDTLVGKATTDTLTNKSISGSSNTVTNVSLVTGVTDILPTANAGASVMLRQQFR